MSEHIDLDNVTPIRPEVEQSLDYGLPAETTDQMTVDQATFEGSLIVSAILRYTHFAVHPNTSVRKEAENWLEIARKTTLKRPPTIS